MTPQIPAEVGPVYEAGIVSPTYGSLGLFLKPTTYHKDMQTQLRDEVIAALSVAVGDRDLAFWKRQSQSDWSEGEGQDYFANAARYQSASALDVSTPNKLRLVPQPTLLKSAAGSSLNGRGAVICKQKAFFSWTDGNYAYVDNTLTVSTQVTGAVGAKIGDIATDGTTVFFALPSTADVYQTAGAVPAPLAAYDAGAFYGRLTYDQLKKLLYASSAVQTGTCILYKINAAGAPTTVYDFVAGRIDTLEMHQGNVIVGWNDASGTIATTGFIGRSRLFSYDGSSVTVLADLPEGTMVVGLKSALGILFVTCVENDPLDPQNSPPAQIFTLYAIIGGTISRIGSTTSGQAVAGPGGFNNYIGSLGMGLSVGRHAIFPLSGNTLRYDTETGGLSKSLGDSGVPAISSFTSAVMVGIALMSTGGLLCELGGGNTTGGIFNLNGTINAIVPSFPAAGTGQLTSSRRDAGLPYVDKFWYALDVNLAHGLATGESVEMEYSIDDAATWVTCSGSPYSTTGQTLINFGVRATNQHVRYRVRPVAATGGSKGPIISAISARYAVVNPNGSIYRMVVDCADQTRARNNRVVDDYAKDALEFLDNIARQNETVTFYEPGDPDRTAHTCWVMSLRRTMPNTGATYNPLKAEGDVDLVLWEAVA